VPFSAGQMLSHHRLIEKIGEGGMGVVWKAEDTRLHRHLREARTASALNHPHICSIHDIGRFEGRRFIVMELLEGQTLQQQIGRRPLEVQTAIDLAIETADWAWPASR